MSKTKPMKDFAVIVSPKRGYCEAYAAFFAVISAGSKAQAKNMAKKSFQNLYEYKQPFVCDFIREEWYRT